ncbi:MAG: hypothetical protein R2710_25795 [Acidimicrobiales bacterium]
MFEQRQFVVPIGRSMNSMSASKKPVGEKATSVTADVQAFIELTGSSLHSRSALTNVLFPAPVPPSSATITSGAADPLDQSINRGFDRHRNIQSVGAKIICVAPSGPGVVGKELLSLLQV